MKLIKAVFKYSSLSIVMVLLCILLLRIIGYLTDHTPSHDIQMKPLVQVDDADNAYLLVSFVDQQGLELGDDGQRLEELLLEWDTATANNLLNKHKRLLSIVEQAAQKKSKIALVNAKLLEEQGDYAQAAHYLITNLRFNNLIKRDANTTLVSYSVGQAYQSIGLKQISEFVLNNEVPDDVLLSLQIEVDKFSGYANDGFELVWSGEHIYSKLSLDSIVGGSFFERLETYKVAYRDAWLDNLFSLSILLVPEYVMQKGKLNAASLKQWKKLQSQSDLLCVDQQPALSTNLPVVEINKIEVPNVTWFEALKPNGFAEAVYVGAGLPQMDYYFNRRCLSIFHINAIKLLISLKRYERANPIHITSLQQLVPDYIDSVPIDPFSGLGIKFDSANRFLYSYGVNLNDDGGSSKSQLSYECRRDSDCLNNPTLLIDAI